MKIALYGYDQLSLSYFTISLQPPIVTLDINSRQRWLPKGPPWVPAFISLCSVC